MGTARRTVVLLAMAVGLVACGGSGDDSSTPAPAPAPTPPGTMSISASPQLVPTPTTAAQAAQVITDANNLAYGAGARGQVFNFTWAAIEPVANQFDAQVLSDLQAALDRANTLSLKQYIGIQVINTQAKSLPPDLGSLPFDNATVQRRFRLLIDRVVGQNRGRIAYLSIGNEVDIYLNAHPLEQAAYRTFYVNAANYARLSDPAIKVGVTGRAEDAFTTAGSSVLTDLNNAGSDVAILTYYPVSTDSTGLVTVDQPSVVANDFTRMLSFAGSKPLVLQEVGYPASTVNNSSQALQAQFVRNVFTAWKAAPSGRIPFLNFFLLHDFTDATCDMLVSFYGVSAPSFRAYLCTLGLRQVNGTPRDSWNALLDESQKAGFR